MVLKQKPFVKGILWSEQSFRLEEENCHELIGMFLWPLFYRHIVNWGDLVAYFS